MVAYKPLKIVGNETGLIQEREEFLLPADAYPVINNAYVWREKIKRKSGYNLLGRLRRNLTTASWFPTAASPWATNLLTVSGYVQTADNANPGLVTTKYAHGLSNGDQVIISGVVGAVGYNNTVFTIAVVNATQFTVGVDAGGFGAYVSGGFWYSNRTITGLEPEAELQPGTVVVTVTGIAPFTDNGLGVLTSATPGNSGTVNYSTGAVVLTHTAGVGVAVTVTYYYYPGLPVMGLRSRERVTVNQEQTIAFDTRYAYRFVVGAAPIGGWYEYLPGYTWTGTNSDFFWTTNYWIDTTINEKLMWATNFSVSDPIRYTNGSVWTDFVPYIISTTPPVPGVTPQLFKALMLLPFRGRLLAFNTYEGTSLGAAVNNPQRIRYSQIGSPTATDAWYDDVRGKGGFLDIPTAEHIVSAGFVRDNLVIYCERSTWQLRYTGQAIAPFQIEKVNTELGAESTFSGVSFDTTLVGIGDKGVVSCDSFQSQRIDTRIPNLVEGIRNDQNGTKRVHGIRDFGQKLAYWIYPSSADARYFPTKRLVYNYENESWATFDDSLTCLGYYQPTVSLRWIDATYPWSEANFPWVRKKSFYNQIVAGNQQGFVLVLDQKVTNDAALSIRTITGRAATNLPTRLRIPNHNLATDDVISITGIPAGTGYATLNVDPLVAGSGIYGVAVIDADTIDLLLYDPVTGLFTLPQLDALQTYIGGGVVAKRDNFTITSKKFGFLDDGRMIAVGFIDVLASATAAGAITVNLFFDYAQDDNVNNGNDPFFNTIMKTSCPPDKSIGQANYWHRVFTQVHGSFVQIQYTLSNAQMVSEPFESDFVIHGQILWQRPSGILR